jgi:hypothetical protein
MITKILVAVSANSTDTVLASAVEIARKNDARIVALHVVDPTPCFLGPYDSDFGLIVEAMEEHGRKRVMRMTSVLDEHAHPAETRMVTLPMLTSLFWATGNPASGAVSGKTLPPRYGSTAARRFRSSAAKTRAA